MGKRSNFEKIEKDRYMTIDPRAVEALDPFLDTRTKFIEPCCGEGHLVAKLEEYGHECVWSSDLDDGVDALSLTSFDLGGNDYTIITNPPWSRDVLHKMIVHFSDMMPTWLLFDADWAYTKQSSEYMQRCTDIVPVGRLIWIPGTKTQGKDNCAWYRFENKKVNWTRFHGR